MIRSVRYVPLYGSKFAFKDAFVVPALGLPTLPNLSRLILTGSIKADHRGVVPKGFTKILRLLPHLRDLRLELDRTFVLEDKSFSIADIPSLRRLEVKDTSACTGQLLNNPNVRLQRLVLWRDTVFGDDSYPILPWSSLTELVIEQAADDLNEIRQFADSFEAVRSRFLP
jgi:hypothetical protein